MSEIAVYMLPVGQGAMNLITEYDGSDLVNLVLIDCGELVIGKNSNDKLISTEAKKFVKSKMKERFNHSTRKVCLDFLLITHRDEDHISFAQDIFDVDEMAISPNDNKVYMRYKGENFTDVYTVFKGSEEMKCERTIRIDAMYTIHTSPDSFIITYKDKQSSFNAECSCKSRYRFSINEYTTDGKNERHIHAYSHNDNRMYVMVNGTCNCVIDIDEGYDYNRMLSLFFKVFDNYCGYPSNKKAIEDQFELLKLSTYKSYDDVLADIDNGETNLKQPIAKCFIGGNEGQAQDTINFICKLTKEYKVDFNPYEDIFNFYSPNIGLRIIHYATISQLKDFYTCYIDSPNNATSAVGLLHDSNNEETFKVLFTGDATHHTFGKIYDDKEIIKMLTGAIWTAPHHGSTITLDAIGDFFPIDNLLEETNIKAVVISAGYKNRFGHPHSEFIEKFRFYLWNSKKVMATSQHTINYNLNGAWVCQDTICPIFTTLSANLGLISPANLYLAHTFKYIPSESKSIYASSFYSYVRPPYKLIPSYEKKINSATPSPSNGAVVAVNEKAKISDADISLKKLFIIR